MKKRTIFIGVSLAIALAVSGCGMVSNVAGDLIGSVPKAKSESEDWNRGFKIAYREVKSIYDGSKTFSNPENDYSGGELFEGKYAVLMMDESDDYPELYKAIGRSAQTRIADLEKTTLEAIDSARTAYEDAIDNDIPFIGPHYYYENVKVIRADDTLVSTTTTIDEFYGGPHNNITEFGRTYDAKTGEELKIGDILTCSEEELNRILAEELHATEEDENQFMDLDNTLSHYKFEPAEADPSDYENAQFPYNWYFAGDGLHFIFNVYELTSYNYGGSDVVLGYDEYEGVIDEKYIPAKDSNYVTSHAVYVGSSKADENGIMLEFVPDGEYKDGYTPEKALVLTLNGKSETIEKQFKSHSTVADYYYVHKKNGKNFINVVIPESDESFNLFVFDITDGTPKAVSAETCEISAETLKDGYTAYPAYIFDGRSKMGR